MKINLTSVASRLLALAAVAVIVFVPQAALAVTNQSLAVPLYARPDSGSYWSDITEAGALTVPFVVASPNNGPGGAPDPVYTAAINKNAVANIRTLGYIQTNYQARTFKDAYNDINTWYQFYPNTKGIFIDLVKEGSAPEVCYVAALYTHVKNIRPNDTVVLSPGTHISAAYEPYGDIFVTASTDYGSYQNWRTQYAGFEDKQSYQNRFWHMIHGVNAEDYSSAFDLVRANNAGWTYITDKTSPTPFASTPAFWSSEKNDVANLPASSIPNRGKTPLPRGCISLSASAENTVDTTVPKQSNTKSIVTVNNTNQTYDSEPITQMQVLSMPNGVTLPAIAGEGWTCTRSEKTLCNFEANLPARSSTKLSTTFQADCNYESGEAVLRLLNYAGNQWDTKVPIRPPIGCDPSTPAGKINKDATGQVLSLTTQSEETTPDITPLGSDQSVPDKKDETVASQSSSTKILVIVILGLLVIGIIALLAIILHRRNRYKVEL